MKEPCLPNPIAGLKFNYEDGFLDENLAKTEIDNALQPMDKPMVVPFDKPIAIVPPLSSDRLFAQKGLFTLQGKGNDMPLNLETGLASCFQKFTIPPKALNDAYAFCQLSGVNEFTAYPDLDGLSRHLQTKYKITRTDLERIKKLKEIP